MTREEKAIRKLKKHGEVKITTTHGVDCSSELETLGVNLSYLESMQLEMQTYHERYVVDGYSNFKSQFKRSFKRLDDYVGGYLGKHGIRYGFYG
jgi:hypothetical protein